MGTQRTDGSTHEAVQALGPDRSAQRWSRILGRIEHRQAKIGLRYWAPPVWLEVTMAGPDADAWPAVTDEGAAWNWQSSGPCDEAEELLAGGADDDLIVDAVGRYTIENLILNAAHEIGEWFRFDGRRLFPAHRGGPVGVGEQDVQGNGTVALRVMFEPSSDVFLDEVGGQRLVRRLVRSAAASRFTCAPGTTISYDARGPVVRSRLGGERARTWRSTWSPAAVGAAGAAAAEVMPLVARDIHRALITADCDRICSAFHIDGARPWHLATSPPAGAWSPSRAGHPGAPIRVLIEYATVQDECDSRTWQERHDAAELVLAARTGSAHGHM